QMFRNVERSSIEQINESKNIRKLFRQRKKQEKQDSVEINNPSLQFSGPVISRNPPPFVFVDTSFSEDQFSSSLGKSEELKGNRKHQRKRKKKNKNKNESIDSDPAANVQLSFPISKLIPGLFAEQDQKSHESEDIISTTKLPTIKSSTTIRTQISTSTTPQTTTTTTVPQHPPKQLKPRPIDLSGAHVKPIPNHGNYPQHPSRSITPQHPPKQLKPRPIDLSGAHVKPIPNHGNYPQHPSRSITPQHSPKQLKPRPIDLSGAHVKPIPNHGNYPQHPSRPITPKPIKHLVLPSVPSQLQYTSHTDQSTNYQPPHQPIYPMQYLHSTSMNTQPYVPNNASSFFASQESQISDQQHVHSSYNIESQSNSRPIHQPQHFNTGWNNTQAAMKINDPSGIQLENQYKQDLHHKYAMLLPSDSSIAHPVIQQHHTPQSSPVNLYSQPNTQPIHNYPLSPDSKSQPHFQLNQGQEIVHPQQIQVQPLPEYQGSLNFNRIKSQAVSPFPNHQPINPSSSTHNSHGFQRPNIPNDKNGLLYRPHQQNGSPILINTGNIPPKVPQKDGHISILIEESNENKRSSQEIHQSKNANEQSSKSERRKNNRKRNQNQKQQNFSSIESSTSTIPSRRKNRDKKDRNNERNNNEELIPKTIINVQNRTKNNQEHENNNNRRNNRNKNKNNNRRRKHKKQDNDSNESKGNHQSNRRNNSSQQKSSIHSKENLSKEIMQSTSEDESPSSSSTSIIKHLVVPPQFFHISGPVYSNLGVPGHLHLFNNSAVNTSIESSNPNVKVQNNSTENISISNSTFVPQNNTEKVQNLLETLTEVEQKFISTFTTRIRPYNSNLREDEEQSEHHSTSDTQKSSNLKRQQSFHIGTGQEYLPEQSHHIDKGQGYLPIKNDHPEAFTSQNGRNIPRSTSIEDDYQYAYSIREYDQVDRDQEHAHESSQSSFSSVESNPSNARPDMQFSPLHFNASHHSNDKILGGSKIPSMRPQYQIPDLFSNSQEQNISKEPEQPADSPT
ncbi:unnamed protein product, partial [Meganyctiphanes norvegica]